MFNKDETRPYVVFTRTRNRGVSPRPAEIDPVTKRQTKAARIGQHTEDWKCFVTDDKTNHPCSWADKFYFIKKIEQGYAVKALVNWDRLPAYKKDHMDQMLELKSFFQSMIHGSEALAESKQELADKDAIIADLKAKLEGKGSGKAKRKEAPRIGE